MAKILCVDDDEQVRELLGTKLEEWGHDVITACDGMEALQRVEQETFDLVLSDWMMPRMTGTELCESMKGKQSTQDIPVILIGYRRNRDGSGPDQPALFHEAGAVDFLTKPFRLDDLQTRLSNALA